MAGQAQDVLGSLRKSIEENIVISKDAEGKIKISEIEGKIQYEDIELIEELEGIEAENILDNYGDFYFNVLHPRRECYAVSDKKFKSAVNDLKDKVKSDDATKEDILNNNIKSITKCTQLIGNKMCAYMNETVVKCLDDENLREKYVIKKNASIWGQGLLPYFWVQLHSNEDSSAAKIVVFYMPKTKGEKHELFVALELLDKANNSISLDKMKELIRNNGIDELEKYEIHIDKNKIENSEIKALQTGDGLDKIKSIRFVVPRDKDKYDVDACDEGYIRRGIEALSDFYEQCIIKDENIIGNLIESNIQSGYKQFVLTGAPGTGKTFGAKEYAKEMTSEYSLDEADADSNTEEYIEKFKVIQFHPSYDYTDFVEGIRPIQNKDNNEMSFVKIDGHFKAFCRMVVEENIKKVEYCENDKSKYTFIKKMYEAAVSDKPLKKDVKQQLDMFNGCPSVNPDYYYFIIDEINRADISKVLGELMYGLEYRGIENRFPTQYQNLNTYDTEINDYMKFDCFKDGFFIPENVIIIGTMNDIDKSVESFDFAMRRRFQWPEVKAEDVMDSVLKKMLCKEEKDSNTQKQHEKEIEALSELIKNMNKVIYDKGSSVGKEKYGLTESHHIGPAYFKKYKWGKDGNPNKNSRERIFNNSIAPILKEYTRGISSDNGEELIKECAKALGVNYQS